MKIARPARRPAQNRSSEKRLIGFPSTCDLITAAKAISAKVNQVHIAATIPATKGLVHPPTIVRPRTG